MNFEEESYNPKEVYTDVFGDLIQFVTVEKTPTGHPSGAIKVDTTFHYTNGDTLVETEYVR